MSDSNDPPFTRAEFLDKPGIVGARWWHEGLVHADPVGRRMALKALMVGGGILAVGVLVSKTSACSSDPMASKNALEMQKTYGWSFGAASEPLTFDGATTRPFMQSLLAHVTPDLTPTRLDLRPYFVPTLLQSAWATPTSTLPDAVAPVKTLDAVVQPIFTASMDWCYRCGKALAALFKDHATDVAVVVDLAGQNSVAFAAGAASVLEPVFAVDNWPHPFGVVPAHLTLAAVAYFQPLFVKLAASRPPNALPLFVLDRARLTPYVDETGQFDNRHVARLPPTEAWSKLGVKRILYVVPAFADMPELDDLNDDFVADAKANVEIRVLATEAFAPERVEPLPPDPNTTTPVAVIPSPDLAPPFYYGGTTTQQGSFWMDYPWVTPPLHGVVTSSVNARGRYYVPIARLTPFSGGSLTGVASKALPAKFGMVPVAVSAATGAVLGAYFARNGSWSRSSGGWGG